MPERLIPASLDVDGIAGLDSRIAAGANVSPRWSAPQRPGQASLSQSELDIDEGLRTAPVVTERLRRGRPAAVATAVEYADWVAAARARRGAPPAKEPVRLGPSSAASCRAPRPPIAGEAGDQVVLIDRRPGRPAAGLAADVHVFDVTTIRCVPATCSCRATPCCRLRRRRAPSPTSLRSCPVSACRSCSTSTPMP